MNSTLTEGAKKVSRQCFDNKYIYTCCNFQYNSIDGVGSHTTLYKKVQLNQCAITMAKSTYYYTSLYVCGILIQQF